MDKNLVIFYVFNNFVLKTAHFNEFLDQTSLKNQMRYFIQAFLLDESSNEEYTNKKKLREIINIP